MLCLHFALHPLIASLIEKLLKKIKAKLKTSQSLRVLRFDKTLKVKRAWLIFARFPFCDLKIESPVDILMKSV